MRMAILSRYIIDGCPSERTGRKGSEGDYRVAEGLHRALDHTGGPAGLPTLT